MTHDSILIIVATLGLLGLGILAGRLAVARKAACALAARHLLAQQEAVRLIRLTAHDLHELGLAVLGHADQLRAERATQASDMVSAASQLMSLADELGAYGLPNASEHILREQAVDIARALEDAVAAVSTQLASGRRSWRLPSPAVPVIVQADTRALRHVLRRVLANAIRHTSQDDWIEVSIAQRPDGLAVIIQDEGSGLATPNVSMGGAAVADSRGIGLRLALARNLMLAHGGRLEVEARAGVGSQVSLIFPPSRVFPPTAHLDSRSPVPMSA